MNPNFYMALIDTGASCTCISGKVIKDLGLTPVGKQPVGGVHGLKPTNLYQFTVAFAFPQSLTPTGALHANIVAYQVNGTEFVTSGGFDVLLGRDVICKGHFSMSFDGHAVLSL